MSGIGESDDIVGSVDLYVHARSWLWLRAGVEIDRAGFWRQYEKSKMRIKKRRYILTF